jgi:DNA-binding transcriptional LysR family regulator
MERLRRLTTFWQWLPAFRVVAETLHLPTAAEILCVSPSALSRSARLMAREVGAPLFVKHGRRLALTDEGREFLAAVRNAMRTVDDGLQQVRSEVLHGTVHVSSTGALTTTFVVPALIGLRRAHPDLQLRVSAAEPAEVAAQLLRGQLDVAFHSSPFRHPELRTEHLGELTMGVYCGPRQELYGREEVTMDDVLRQEFVTPLPAADGTIPDGWPAAHPRRIALQVDQMRVGLDTCRTSDLVAVLPDALAGTSSELWRLPIDSIPPAEIFTLHRTTLGAGHRADRTIVAAVRAEIAARRGGAGGRREETH